MITALHQSASTSCRSYLTSLTARSRIPGLQYVAVTSEGLLFEHVSGWADIHRQIPIDTATTMMAYSMSKPITAAAILLLVQNGRIGLDDPAAQYIDALPYGAAVTIRQLISHTSGIPNPIPLRWVHRAESHSQFDEDAALATVLHDYPHLSFKPGTKYAYSNIGYWLLGKIVERATGLTFSSFVTQQIFGPLSIKSQDLAYAVPDVPHHAMGYLEKYSLLNLAKRLVIDRNLVGEYSGRWLSIRSHYPNGPAFGGLVGTARGFGKFLQDQLREQSLLFERTAQRAFVTRQLTARGNPIPMTLGWHIERANSHSFLFKEGGGGGYHCMMRLYPREGIGTVVMTNATAFRVQNVLNAVDPQFLRERGLPARNTSQ